MWQWFEVPSRCCLRRPLVELRRRDASWQASEPLRQDSKVVLRPWASLVAESSEPRQRRRSKLAAASARSAAPGPGPEASASPGAPRGRRRSRRRPAPAAATAADAAAAPRLAPLRPAAGDDTPAELLLVGRVVAAQGLGGELRVQPLSDFPERFTSPGRRWLRRRGEPAQCWQLLSGRQLPGRELFVLRLAGIEDRTAAEALVGADLLVASSDRPTLAEGEFHLLDLVGLEVRLLPQGRPIGRVEDLIHAGQDLLEISLWGEAPGAGGEATSATALSSEARRLIPFVHAIVPEVHLAEGWLGLTPPPGLLELEGMSGNRPQPGALEGAHPVEEVDASRQAC